MNSIFTVIRFTYRNKVRSRAFLISSLLLAVVITVAVNLPYIVSRLSLQQPVKIGIVQTQSEIPSLVQKYFSLQSHPSVSVVIFATQGSQSADQAMLENAVTNKKIVGYLDLQTVPNSAFPTVTYKTSQSAISKSMVSTELQAAFQSAKTQVVVTALGLTPQQLKALYDPVAIHMEHISASGTASKNQTQAMAVMASVLVYALLMLLFMSVMISGTMIANEVTAEKSSRVMEILISSVSPLKQMFGKIIGVGLVVLSQIAAFIAVALLNANLPQNVQYLQQYHLTLRDIPVSLLVYFLLFYIIGYFLYATLFAAIGSLVSRTEDLGQAVMPVTFLLLGGFYIALYGIQAPTSPLIVGMSFFPFYTPLLMFLRLGLSQPPVWQVMLSMAILLGSVYLMTWLAAKIYRTGVLMYGKRPSWRELRKAMKAMKI